MKPDPPDLPVWRRAMDKGLDLMREIVEKHAKEILGIRNAQLEKALLLKMVGVDVRLVEEVDGRRTTWHFEFGEPDAGS